VDNFANGDDRFLCYDDNSGDDHDARFTLYRHTGQDFYSAKFTEIVHKIKQTIEAINIYFYYIMRIPTIEQEMTAYYLNLQFLNNVMFIKTKVVLSQT
jgi:hypothetical protein